MLKTSLQKMNYLIRTGRLSMRLLGINTGTFALFNRLQCRFTFTVSGHKYSDSSSSSACSGRNTPCIFFPRTRFNPLPQRFILRAIFSCSTAPCHSFLSVRGTNQQSSRTFHTSGRLRALPVPVVWMLLKPLQKLVAIILGRSIRKWWKSLPPNKKQLFREWAWRRRWHVSGAGAALLLLFSVFCFTHLDESPVTNRTRLLVFSKDDFMELAKALSEEYMEEYKDSLLAKSDPRHQVVDRLVQHLVQRNQDIAGISSFSWTVHIVDSNDMQAFVLPNGEVFVFTGMLRVIEDIHELSFVLGHEMAHALISHSAEGASLSHMVEFLSVILLTAIWAVCPRDSLAILVQWIQGRLVKFLFDRPYSRKLEAEADKVGLQMAAKACADVRAGPVFWQKMEVFNQINGEPTIPEWLSTHPTHLNRAVQLERLIPEVLELRESCDCPALPADDPRAVFSKTVRLLLDNKAQMTGNEEQNARAA